MTARDALARAGFLCAVGALSACAGNSHNSAQLSPVAAPVQNISYQPSITPAATALARVTGDLGVSVRQINAGARPTEGLLASADISPRTVLISSRLQCVPFARERSGVAIRGNANTWWNQAAGEFVRLKTPAIGAVVVMQTTRGHVAVVTKIVDSRTVIIDHANWLSNGQIYLDQPMMDVSASNDWSKVVIWHPSLGEFGKRALGVSGFIMNASAHGSDRVYASLADVPSSMAPVQYASAEPAPVAKAVPAVAVAQPVLVASASVPSAYVPEVSPVAKPNSVTLVGRPGVTVPATPAPAPAKATPAPAVEVAAATPTYVDTIVPAAKPAAIGGKATPAAPVAIASAETKPTYVDIIVPKSKPLNGDTAATAIAMATPAPATKVASASATYVDIIVPRAKPSQMGGAKAVAMNDTARIIPASADAGGVIPLMKPAIISGKSVATFR